jgi:hypothetical protein
LDKFSGRNFRATQASVFGLIDDALATTAEFFEDSIVGDGLPDE